jgi:hypothetical protein
MRVGGGRRAKGWAMLALLPLSLCSCVQRSAHAPIQAVALEPLKGEIAMEYRRDTYTNKPKNAAEPQTRSESTEARETINLETDGYVYHPNLVDLSLAGTFGLSQSDFSDNSGDKQTEGMLTEFDVEGDILKKQRYPMSVAWRRQSDIISRQFAPPLQQESTLLSTSLRMVSPKFPTAFTYSNLHTMQDTSFAAPGQSDSLDLTENAFGWNTDALFSPDHMLRWNASLSQLESTDLLRRREDELELNLEDSLIFGSDNQYDLTILLGYLDRTGDPSFTQSSWFERLSVQHRENLRTHYSLDSRRIDQSDGAQQTNQLGVGLYHKLFESLSTAADTRLTKTEFPSGATRDEVDGLLSWDYRKNNPMGVLLANLTLERTNSQESGPVSTGTVVDEEHVLVGTIPVTLSARRIDLDSVVVTDLARTTIYDTGDYALRPVGDFVELERLLGGDIPDPGTVLVSYEYGVGGDLDTETDRWSTALRQEFSNGLAVYVRHYEITQTFSGADAGAAVPDNVDSDLVGVEYTRRNFHLQAETEDRQSTVQPVKSTRLRADYRSRLARDVSSRVGTDYTVDRFTAPPERNRTVTSLFGGLGYRPGSGLSVDTYAAYVHNDDDVGGVTDGLALRLGLSWAIRRVTVNARYEHNVLTQSLSSDRSDDSLIVSVSRKF